MHLVVNLRWRTTAAPVISGRSAAPPDDATPIGVVDGRRGQANMNSIQAPVASYMQLRVDIVERGSIPWGGDGAGASP